ncbi:AHH domain-containing protein [Lysinibacillus irui]|uniref:AHH domain-containing protein n=1 Tax=Lysinibacillus irui TaxID=2998077 RepID=UPI00388AD482
MPFRYQGQYEDVEIGLYYNPFRYYDPEQGNYTQIDPIGLAGGNPTLYGYVYNPHIETDPYGLAFGKSMPASGWNYGNMPKPDGYQLHHIIPKSLAKGANPHEIFKLSGYDIDNIRNTIYLPTRRDNHPTRSIHRGYNSFHAQYNRDIRQELDILLEVGDKNKWTTQQYHDAIQELINDQRQDLRKGRTKLHCEG